MIHKEHKQNYGMDLSWTEVADLNSGRAELAGNGTSKHSLVFGGDKRNS